MTWPLRLTRRRLYVPDELKGGRAVVLAACVLITAHLAVRAWALYGGGWFYTDDFRLLYEARTSALSMDFLLRPYDSQFMPAGRFVAWLVERSGTLNWGLVATLSITLQAVTSVTCFLMLRSLFGLRPAVLAPLAFYLFTAIPFPAFMWWAASLNQLPMQLSLFLSVWAWVDYLRRPTSRHAILTVLALAVGLVFYVKTLLILPFLALLAMAYFANGAFFDRVRYLLRKYWLGLTWLTVTGGAFAAYYVINVPQLARMRDAATVWGIFETYVVTSFPSAVLGGPWLWWQHHEPPTSRVDVPPVAALVCWAVLTLVVVTTALLRRRSLRAWGLVAAYLLLSFALVVTSRGGAGPLVGLELRYLTDLAAVVTIGLGLAYLPLLGAVESSVARVDPPLPLRRALPVGLALLLVVCLGGVVSSFGYARTWHLDNPGRRYVDNAVESIRSQGKVVNLADEEAPPNVMIQWTYPHNLLSRLLPLTGAPVRFPAAAEDLYTLDGQGRLQAATVRRGVTAVRGEVPGCGWLVRSSGRTLPLSGQVLELEFWMRIGYMSSADGEILLTAGTERMRVPVRGGLHDVYVQTDGGYSSVRVDGLAGDQVLCVTDLEIGPIAPGARP